MASPDPSAPASGQRLVRDPRGLQAVVARLLSLLEIDRHAVSRELHDQIGQAVTAMKLSAHLAMDEDDPGQRREDLQEIVRIADDTIERLRDMSMRLRPPQLDALGLEAALRGQADRWLQTPTVQVRLHIRPLAQRADRDVELACFRIAEDALAQALRDARPRTITLSLRDAGEGLLLRIDDGADDAGNDYDATVLALMHERARIVGGSLRVDRAHGTGTHLSLSLPLRAANPSGTTDPAGA